MGPQQGVGGLWLVVEHHPHHLGPAFHPFLSQHRCLIKGGITHHQPQQNFAAVGANPQHQVAQHAGAAFFVVGGPAGGFEVFFKRCDQFIKAGIQHQAVVHVHHVMAVAAIEARLKAVGPPLNRNDGAVAVAQHRLCRQDRLHLEAYAAQAVEGLLDLLLFPLGLGRVTPVLEAAAATVGRQDAGGLAPFGRGLVQGAQFAAQHAAAAPHQAGLHPFAGQGTANKNDAPLRLADAIALVAEVADLHIEEIGVVWGMGHPMTLKRGRYSSRRNSRFPAFLAYGLDTITAAQGLR